MYLNGKSKIVQTFTPQAFRVGTVLTWLVEMLSESRSFLSSVLLHEIPMQRKEELIAGTLKPKQNEPSTCRITQDHLMWEHMQGSSMGQKWRRKKRSEAKKSPEKSSSSSMSYLRVGGRATSPPGARAAQGPVLLAALPLLWHCSHTGCKHIEGGVVHLPSPSQTMFCSWAFWSPKPVQMHIYDYGSGGSPVQLLCWKLWRCAEHLKTLPKHGCFPQRQKKQSAFIDTAVCSTQSGS